MSMSTQSSSSPNRSSTTPPNRSSTTEVSRAHVRKRQRKRRIVSTSKRSTPSFLLSSLVVRQASTRLVTSDSQSLQKASSSTPIVFRATKKETEKEGPDSAQSAVIVRPIAHAKKTLVSPKPQKLYPVLENTCPFYGEHVYCLHSVVYYPANFKSTDRQYKPVCNKKLNNATILKRVIVPSKPVSITSLNDSTDTSEELPHALATTSGNASVSSSTTSLPSTTNSGSSSLPSLKKSTKNSSKQDQDTHRRKEENTIRVYFSFNMFMVPKSDNAILSRYGAFMITQLRQFEHKISHLTTRLAPDSALRGCPRNIVVFKGGYPDLKRYFLDKGWIINPEKDTATDFNIKFAIKTTDLDRTHLYPWQYTNHFTNSQIITTKNGLTRCLANNDFDIDIDRFFPRSYRVVNVSDAEGQAQLQLMSGNDDTLDFIEDYLNTEVLKICFEWIRDPKVCDSVIDWEDASTDMDSIERVEVHPSCLFKYSQVQLQLAYQHLLYLTSILLHYDIDLDRKTRFVVAPLTQHEIRVILPKIPHQYQLPNYYESITPQSLISQGKSILGGSNSVSSSMLNGSKMTEKHIFPYPYSSSTQEIHANVMTAQEYHHMARAIGNYLLFAPQMSIRTLLQNIFIGKPGAKSRGRGIFCSNDIAKLLVLDEDSGNGHEFELPDEAAINSSDRYVVQRYVETPLLLGGYKFDVRQWVFVSSLNPMIIFQWTAPYLRFCSSKYSVNETDLKNPYIHLSNNSVQKYADEFGKDDLFLSQGNMWGWSQFSEHLEQHIGKKYKLNSLSNIDSPDPQNSCYYKTEEFHIRAPPTSCGHTYFNDSVDSKVNGGRPATRELYKDDEIVEDDGLTKGKNNKQPLYKQKYAAKEHARLYGEDIHGTCPKIYASDYKRSQYTDKLVFDTIADRILYDMARIIITTMQAARFDLTSSENTFELFGYDFIVDDALQVWLIEINASPTLEHSTKLVTDLIDRMIRGLVNIIVDSNLGTKIRTKKHVIMPKITNAEAIFGVEKGINALEGWRLIYCEKQKLSLHSADITVFGREISFPGVVVAE